MSDEDKIAQLEATVVLLERRLKQLREQIEYLKRRSGKWPDKLA